MKIALSRKKLCILIIVSASLPFIFLYFTRRKQKMGSPGVEQKFRWLFNVRVGTKVHFKIYPVPKLS